MQMDSRVCEIEFSLPDNLPTDVGTEIKKRAYYCDEGIINCDFVEEENVLVIQYTASVKKEEIEKKVALLIEQMKPDRLALKPEILKSRTGNNKCNYNIVSELYDKKELQKEGLGTVSKSGRFLELLERLDDIFQKIGKQYFNAKPVEYNVLMPSEWLKKAGYFTSFAHSLTFAMHLKEDYFQIEEFISRHQNNEDLNFASTEELSTPHHHCLSPAVCYHAYGGLENQKLTKQDAGLKVITAMGKCFRYESKNMTDLDRLWEFSMREIILIGEKDKVLENRATAIELIWKMVELLGLDASIETASDPFFASDYKSLRFFQLTNQLKFELQLPVSDEKSIAAASFNYHESFFGDKFSIQTEENSAVHTGCVAFGLERFAFACISQLGFTETKARLDKVEQEMLTNQDI
jgi:hypothetical protein